MLIRSPWLSRVVWNLSLVRPVSLPSASLTTEPPPAKGKQPTREALDQLYDEFPAVMKDRTSKSNPIYPKRDARVEVQA
jgi:hypothetical protein